MKKLVLFILLTSMALSGVLPMSLSLAQDGDGLLAPEGVQGELYYAPFAHSITLDGDLSDWDNVPKLVIPASADLTGGGPALQAAVSADAERLYLMANVLDENIISGEHNTDYWNEDSVEFYLNATGDYGLTSYTQGVAQITIPPLNIGKSGDEIVFAGVQADTIDDKQLVVFATETGWAVELSLPLESSVWSIQPQHGGTLGFQVHLNGASSGGRDTKLIWSSLDMGDSSYFDPSVFGRLVFFEIGQSDVVILESEIAEPDPTPELPAVEADAAYKNAELPITERVEDLISRMTLDEKIGQMTLVEKGSINVNDIAPLAIGGVLSGGGGYPRGNNTAEGWAEMVDGFQVKALESRLGIPIIYGVDAVHGHGNLYGATLFPHNIGMGATRNPELVEMACRATAAEMVATGIYWNYSPVLAVVQDIRWGRTYEAYAENTELVTELAVACIQGLQGDSLAAEDTVLATPKHYIGDGGTTWGSSTTGNYQIDQGVTEVDEDTLRSVHLPPYIAALNNGAQNIMTSYSSWDGLKMHAQHYLVTEVLKGELGFSGFIVSDWAGMDQITPDYYEAMVIGINAGNDMNMVPYDYKRFIRVMNEAVENGDISIERIDDAVRRILTVKFELGLFERPFSNPDYLASVGSDEHRAIARQAVAESQVLLKNDNNLLPLAPSITTLLVAGEGADDIGIQVGGWSIEWQGKVGDITLGTTILEGIAAAVSPETNLIYNAFGNFGNDANGNPIHAEVGIAVVAERPYAEGVGDSEGLRLDPADLRMVRKMQENVDTLIVIIVSGRPVIITDQIENWDAVVATWLPGTEGAGVADVLFGTKPFTGKLPFTWPRSAEQLPFDFANLAEGDALFPYGFGLTTE